MKTMIRAVNAINTLKEKETGIQYFEVCLRYILSANPQLSKDQMNTVLKQIVQTYPEGSEITMTFADRFIQQGLEQGRKEAKTETLSELALKVLTKKFGTLTKEDQETVSTLNLTSLELIIEEFWQYNSLKELKQKYF